MTEHTKEPWKIGTPPPNGEQTIGTDYGLMVAVATTGAGINTEANARRIVACVNACRGIRTEALEHRVHLLAAEDDTISVLKAQRDQLLAALETLVEAHDTECSDTDRRWALVDARLALAAVKGD